jgi:hypothetical protein
MLRRADLENLLGTARRGQLWTPHGPPRPVPTTVAPHRVTITCEDVGLATPDPDAVAAMLTELPRAGAIECVSRLAISVANLPQPANQAQELELARLFLPEDLVRKFRSLIGADPARGIFNRLQLLTLMRLLLTLPIANSGAEFKEREARVVGLAALAINGHFEKDVSERLNSAPSSQDQAWVEAAFGIRNMLFNRGSHLIAQLIGRSVLLWSMLPAEAEFRPAERISPQAVFEQATGLPLDDYLVLVLLYCVLYETYCLLPLAGKNTEFFFLAEDRPPIQCPENLVASHATLVRLLTAHADPDSPDRILRNLYDLGPLRAGPLAMMPDGFRTPVDLTFLKEAAPILTFWLINDYLQKQGGPRESERWRRFFGPLLEYYVQRLTQSVIDPALADPASASLRRIYGQADWQIAKQSKGETPHLPDVAIVYPGKLVLIEVIATRFHFMQTAIAANPERLQRDLDQMVYQPAIQLDGVIGEIRAGNIRLAGLDLRGVTLYPVVVIGDSFAQFPRVWDLIIAELDGRGLLRGPERAKLQVWDIDEFESLLGSLEPGHPGLQDLVHVLDDKTSDARTRFMPLQNYLYVKDIPSQVPTMIRRAFDRVWNPAHAVLESALAAARTTQQEPTDT